MSFEKIPETMRALMYQKPPGALHLVTSHKTPQPDFAADEHLIKVHSFAITKGELQWPLPEEAYKDYSPGVEGCGTVVACPPDSKFPVGSRVYLRITFPRCGAAREYTIALGSELAFQPENLTPEQAAAVPVSALTAWQALFVQAGYDPSSVNGHEPETSQKQKKRRILIMGASGSVSVWATQLARAAGFEVTGTCHTRNVQLVRDMGVHEVIDYTKTSVRQWVEGKSASQKFDLVLDCVGGDGTSDAWYAAHPERGQVLAIVLPPGESVEWTINRPEGVSDQIRGHFFIMNSDGRQLQEITNLIEIRGMRPVVDSVYKLEDYRKAFERVDSGKATGKVVVRI